MPTLYPFNLLKKIPIKYLRYTAYSIFLIILTPQLIVKARPLSDNGFDLSDIIISADEIYHGGPPKDGIPAIDKPIFINATAASYLTDTDRVLGIHRNGISKAYPISILNHHEIVNDSFQQETITVSYCPLCGTGVAFKANDRTFGVSGLLYNSDVLLYDRETESLWSQLLMKAISGTEKNTTLTPITMAHTVWQDWRERYPNTLVLSQKTGYSRNYQTSPYGSYDVNTDIYFPVSHTDRRYHPKELVIGLELNNSFKAYPFTELALLTNSQASISIVDEFQQQPLTVTFNSKFRTGTVTLPDQQEVPTVIAFWFAWTAFHPDTEVFTAAEHP